LNRHRGHSFGNQRIIGRDPQKYVPNIFLAEGARLPESHAAHSPLEAIPVKRGIAGDNEITV
jgi:hypothetical protein